MGQLTAAGAAKMMGKDEEAKHIAKEAAKTLDWNEKKKRIVKEQKAVKDGYDQGDVSKVVLNSALIAMNVLPATQIPAQVDALDIPEEKDSKDTYDIIILGTGIKQSILAGLLSQKGKRVLLVDQNEFLGSETQSLNLTNMWEQFYPGTEPPAEFGQNMEWNIDLIPKLMLENGKLVQMLKLTQATKFLELKSIQGSYVAKHIPAGFLSKEKISLMNVP